MQNVSRTETREERRVTREYYTDSNSNQDFQDIPSSFPSLQSTNQTHNNFSSNSILDNFSNHSNPIQILSSSPSQNQWTTTNRVNTSTTNKTFSSDAFDDSRSNNQDHFFSPPSSRPSSSLSSNTRQDVNNTNSTTTKKVVSNTTKTNQTFVSDSFDDDRNNKTTTKTTNNYLKPCLTSSSPSPYSTRPGSGGQDVTNNTRKTTLEERLHSKEMKTCKLEDLWTVEPTRYTMLIPVDRQYGPEDVNITMKDRVMSVVVKNSMGGFGKSFSVPRDAEFQGIQSTFTTDGNLRIEVPRKK